MAATPTARRIALRDMAHADLAAVRRIESAAYQDAWPARIFEQELRNDFARYRVAVARGSEERGAWRALRQRLGGGARDVLGFMGAWYMVDQFHLVTIAVDPAEQSRGIGQRLLLDCFDLAIEAELPSIVLEVRESNERAQRLYQHFGFRVIGRQRQYYQDNREGALVMQVRGLATPEGRDAHEQRRRAHRDRYGEQFEEALPGG